MDRIAEVFSQIYQYLILLIPLMILLLRRRNKQSAGTRTKREDASQRKSRKQAKSREYSLNTNKRYRGQFGESKELVPQKASTEETPFQAKEKPEQLIRRLMKTQGIRSPFEAIHLLQKRGKEEAPHTEYFPAPAKPKKETSSPAYEFEALPTAPGKSENSMSTFEKFEKTYPPAMRAVIYSEILGKPRGLS